MNLPLTEMLTAMTQIPVWSFTGLALILALISPAVGYILTDWFGEAKEVKETLSEKPVSRVSLAQESPSFDTQMERIGHIEIPDLLQLLPANSWHKETWFKKNGRLRFVFECNSETQHFFATAKGSTPLETFFIAKHRLLNQVSDWRRTRFESVTSENSPILQPSKDSHHGPRVLIVDDDVDMALAMQTALGQLGCQTEVATSHEGLHRKLVNTGADYIFLDWRLNDNLTADKVVEKAVRLIDVFSDLRTKFSDHKPCVVTHSVLERDKVILPHIGHSYFNHLDHWQKPMPFHEMVRKASDLILLRENP